MAKQGSNKMSFGITLIIFGILFLLKNIGILYKLPMDIGQTIISDKILFIIAGLVFIIRSPKSIAGWIFIVIGILLILASIFTSGFLSAYAYLYIPVGFLIAGISLILSKR